MILTDHENLWSSGPFGSAFSMLMETLGIVPSGPAQNARSVPRAERENRPCCVIADGEQQPRRFHLQGRLDVGSDTDTLKELKCSRLLMLLNTRAEPDLITTCVWSG